MIDTRHLQTIRAIADSGSFTQAAVMLGCVQSNVTARMRKLEERLGVALFEREGRRTSLTRAGEVLDGYAQQILSLIHEAEDAIADGDRAGLRLGAMENTMATRLPALVKHLHHEFPNAPLKLVTGPTDELIADVATRKLDAAFVAGPVGDTALDSVAAFTETLVQVRPKGGSGNLPLLAFRQGCSYRAQAERWLRGTGATPVSIIEMGTLDGMLGCVTAGIGIAVVPRGSADISAYRDGFDVEDLPEDYRISRTSLIWLRDRVPVKSLRELISCLSGSSGI